MSDSGWGAGSGRRPYHRSSSGRCDRRQETSHESEEATVGGVRMMEGGAGRHREVGRRRGGIPGIPVREAIDTAAGAAEGGKGVRRP